MGVFVTLSSTLHPRRSDQQSLWLSCCSSISTPSLPCSVLQWHWCSAIGLQCRRWNSSVEFCCFKYVDFISNGAFRSWKRFSRSLQDCQLVSSTVLPRLLEILSEQLYYDEIAIPFTRMQNECKQLIALLADADIDLKDRLNCNVFTIDQANDLVHSHTHTGTFVTPSNGTRSLLTARCDAKTCLSSIWCLNMNDFWFRKLQWIYDMKEAGTNICKLYCLLPPLKKNKKLISWSCRHIWLQASHIIQL